MIRRSAFILLVPCVFVGCDRPSASSQSTPRTEPTPSGPIHVPDAAAQLPLSASDGGARDASTSAASVRFDGEPLGAPPASFEPVVGDWTIGQAGGATGLLVDGSRWREGTPSANLADQAKRLYGDRYAEFLDGVKTFAFYPLAVQKEPAPEGDIRLSVRFYPIAGKIDQAAGIAFGISPDGSYFGVRANALEDNLLYFKVVKGKRTVVDTVRSVPTPSRTWHTLVVDIRGRKLTVQIDGARRFEKVLDSVPSGRVGLWSKADSQVLFDDFEITRP